MIVRLWRQKILGYGFSEWPGRIEGNYEFIHTGIHSYVPEKNFTAGGIDQSGARTRGGFVSWFSDQGLLLGTSQWSRDLGQGVPGESAGQVLGPG